MGFGAGDYLDAEILAAPRLLTSDLYHYTTADAGVFGILRSGRMRLSPLESTNDLWESKPSYPGLQVHEDDRDLLPGMELWADIDREIRLRAKVACFTQDWSLPDSIDGDVFRGWAHLAIWAHYGGAHSGLCLRFDREALVAALKASTDEGIRSFDGPVTYRATTWAPMVEPLDVGQAREFGVDAVAALYAERHHRGIFFEKHQDWASESEYRLVRLDQSRLPFELDIRQALTGVVLGERFPEHRIPALIEVLKQFDNVAIFQTAFHNRHPVLFPYEHTIQEQPVHPWAIP